MSRPTRSGHQRLRWVVAGLVGLVIIAAGGTIAYSHAITAADPLTLPRVDPATDASSLAVDGVCHVGPGSVVGWRVHQVLLGQQSTLVSRTGKVRGSFTSQADSVWRP